MAAPVIEAADVTQSSNNSADATPSVAFPAYGSGDLIIEYLMTDDNDAITPPATGPNGETRFIVGNGDSGSASGPVIAAIWFIGTATQTSGTHDWAIAGGGEQWIAQTIFVASGEFDSGNPVDSVSGIGGSSSSISDVPTPAWSTTTAGGRVVVGAAVDADPLTGVAANWTDVQGADIGAVTGHITTRDAETTTSESISSVNHSTIADTSSTLGLVINGPAAGDVLMAQVMM